MGPRVSSVAALLLMFLLRVLFGVSSVLGQDLRERDALCNIDGCFMVYFQRRTFLDSWRACKEKGGNLATIKRKEDASTIATLFSTLDLRHSRTKVQVWIGLQRQPRQCSTMLPLRGFSWTNGDQDTDYTNWQTEDSSDTCKVPRCVMMGYTIQDETNNFKWLDGACSVPVDGYLCHYAYKGMCPPLWNEGGGFALYTTPFNLLSKLLTHIPLGSAAILPCPRGIRQEQTVLCILKEDGSVGWSRPYPLCSNSYVPHNWCAHNNGGCEHFCHLEIDQFYCECADGYHLGDDGESCELDDCEGAPCQFECLPLSDGYRCACPEGYMLAPDEVSCLDVDECLLSPCEYVCVNALGSFECICREGYDADHEGGCVDIDECLTNPCEHACENTPGSHVCHCKLGFSPVPEDPSRCQDTDQCQILGACEQMCVNYGGGEFECYCKEGYELMPDQYSCQKRREGHDRAAITPPFLWATHQPGFVWKPIDYDWTLQQSQTDWPPEGEQSLDWRTDPPRDDIRVLNSDVIRVTSVPQEELGTLTQDNQDSGQSESELEDLSTTIYTTLPPTISFRTVSDLYKDEREKTTAYPLLSTSTISEGAWNWQGALTTSRQRPGNTEDSVRDHNMVTDSSNHNEGEEEQFTLREHPQFPEEELKQEGEGYVGTTFSQDPTVPTQFTSSWPPQTKGGETSDVVYPVKEDSEQKQSNIWLLVGLLVPTCIVLVVLVALGIIYFSHCAAQPRNKNVNDCYHWISGAHDKQGAPNPSAEGKTPV